MIVFNINTSLNGKQMNFRQWATFRIRGDLIIKELVKMTVFNLYGEIKQRVPVDKGRLRSSFQIMKKNDLKYEIVSGVHYGPYQDEGTGIYVLGGGRIVPRVKKALKFKIGGKTVFAKSVKGVRPKYFTRDSINATERKLDNFLMLALEQNDIFDF